MAPNFGSTALTRGAIACAIALASSYASASCSDHIPAAARRYATPEPLLRALIHTESSGHALAIRTETGAAYPASRSKAARLASAADTPDVGCGQISMRWHNLPIHHALRARVNVFYTARYLHRLYEQHGTWSAAVAAYHSGQGHDPTYLQAIAHELQETP